ncbi:MAG TPA: DUF4097 family beta strand repeat-containing protein [Actinomycetota bacterium]|nr:DUF4097 family beta strand repeat-containing protein [Actinomycetota bacterium]
MPTFDTPEPISVDVELGVGDIRIEASDRADTIVEVRPSDPTKTVDRVAAEDTRAEYASGHLSVNAPGGGWRGWLPRRSGSIDVTIHLPAGSQVHAEAGVAAFRSSGRIGACRCKLGVGDVQLDEAGPVDVKTGFGDVTIERAVGRSEIVTGTGAVRIGSIGGPGIVKNSNGDTWIGEVVGDARVRAANGRISIDRAHEGVVAKTANGAVRLGEVARGVAVAESAAGEIEVGVRDGVSAWLDLHTKFGEVQNDLEASGGPDASEDSVEVRASTSYGNIAVRRSFASHAGSDAP